MINFRGSIGYGYDALKQLVGKGGEVDVNDCIDIINQAVENHNIDQNRIGLFGYSHGGYLSAYLAGIPSFADKVKCAFVGNGVLGPQIIFNSNIPSWTYAVLQTQRRMIEWPVSSEDLARIYKSTPL